VCHYDLQASYNFVLYLLHVHKMSFPNEMMQPLDAMHNIIAKIFHIGD